jgi:hypothetical protein
MFNELFYTFYLIFFKIFKTFLKFLRYWHKLRLLQNGNRIGLINYQSVSRIFSIRQYIEVYRRYPPSYSNR